MGWLRLVVCGAALSVAFALVGCATTGLENQHGQLHVADWNLDLDDSATCKPLTADRMAALKAYAVDIPADVILFRVTATTQDAERIFPKEHFADLQWASGPGCTLLGVEIPRLVGVARRRGGPRPFAVDRIGPSPTGVGLELSIRVGPTPLLRLLELETSRGCEEGQDGPACAVLFDERDKIASWFGRQGGQPAMVWGSFHRDHYHDDVDVFFDGLMQPKAGMTPGHWPYPTCHNPNSDNNQTIWSASAVRARDYVRPVPWKGSALSESCALVIDVALRDLAGSAASLNSMGSSQNRERQAAIRP